MNSRKLMYIAISIVCVLSIIVGIYAQIKPKKNKSNSNSIIINGREQEYTGKTQEQLKKEFNNIFDNKFHMTQYDTTNISKLDPTQEIVYTVYTTKDVKENYDVEISLPLININSEVASKFNQITQKIFADKANEIFNLTEGNTIYTVSYTGYINGDIMSVIINSTLKEGNNAQRMIVQTYNYNLKTGKEATIEDVTAQRGVSNDDVTKIINTQVKEAIKEAKEIQISGYEVYSRDINDEMYKLENSSTYYLGNDGALYIIYAYGNQEFTSEMDIIVI